MTFDGTDAERVRTVLLAAADATPWAVPRGVAPHTEIEASITAGAWPGVRTDHLPGTRQWFIGRGGFACVAFVWTGSEHVEATLGRCWILPECRGHDAQRALIEARLNMAQKLGCASIFAIAPFGSASFRNLLLAGFSARQTLEANRRLCRFMSPGVHNVPEVPPIPEASEVPPIPGAACDAGDCDPAGRNAAG